MKLHNIILLTTIITITFNIISCKSDSSNNNNNKTTNNTTNTKKGNNNNEVEQNKIQDYKIPDELKYSIQGENFLYDKFFPIGWSKDGKFAYIVEPTDEASGLYFFELVIKNMISDKVEWSWKPKKNTEEGNLETIWTKNYEIFKKKLNDYGIIQQTDHNYVKGNFTYDNKNYSITLKSHTKLNQDYGFDVIVGTDIFIESPELGKKQVYEFKEDDYSMILGEIITGQIISPYEGRIAIILKQERWGWEGPPNVISFVIIGSNLSESFKKES